MTNQQALENVPPPPPPPNLVTPEPKKESNDDPTDQRGGLLAEIRNFGGNKSKLNNIEKRKKEAKIVKTEVKKAIKIKKID